MNKRIAAMAAVLVLVASIASAKDKANKKTKTPKMVELLDWKGKESGREMPEWVEYALDVDDAGVHKALGLGEDKKVFVLWRDSEMLDFLEAWYEQLDARSEVASYLKMHGELVVQTWLQINNADAQVAHQEAVLYSEQIANMPLNGLHQADSFWYTIRRLKIDVKRAKKDEDYDYNTAYVVALVMDVDEYMRELKTAIGNVEDNNGWAASLQDILVEAWQPTQVLKSEDTM